MSVRKRSTLRDVAALAGVHQSSVAVALNNAKSGTGLSAATRERIHWAAKELDYRPNVFAKQLLGKRNKTLAAVLPGAHNPFYTAVAHEIEIATAELGYRLFTVVQLLPMPNAEDVEMWPVDGVFIWSAFQTNVSSVIGAPVGETAVVYLGYQVEDQSEHISFDLAGGARDALQHLVSRGYTRIACAMPVFDKDRAFPDVRWLAYLDFCKVHGIAPQHLDIEKDLNRQISGFHLGQRLATLDRADRPDAVFVAGDSAAIGVYHGALHGGLKIPTDLAIVGFDGIDEGQHLDKPLTSVRCPAKEFGQAAAEVMVRRLSADMELCAQQVMIPTSLIVGQTT